MKVSLPEGEESNICEHEFVVTALFDRLELGHPTAYIGKEYHNDYSDGWVEVNCVINVPESEKPQYIRRIKELIGDDAINTPDEWARYELSEYDSVFSIIERLITVTVLFGSDVLNSTGPATSRCVISLEKSRKGAVVSRSFHF